MLILRNVILFVILSQFTLASNIELIQGGENDNGVLNISKWSYFGQTYGQQSRMYKGKKFIYSSPKDTGSGMYQAFSTEVGKRYRVSAILIGSDTNREEQFNGISYLTISSAVPTQNKSHVIAESESVTGANERTVTFTFDATSTSSYLALRSDRAWHYASARAISVKEIGEGDSEKTKPNEEDKTIPKISIVGDNPLNIRKGESYKEYGAIANDNRDGDITSKITIDSSSVDTKTVGVYHVLYNVKDSAGNRANEVSRIVKVFEENYHYKLSKKFTYKTLYDVNSPWNYSDNFLPWDYTNKAVSKKNYTRRYCKTRPDIRYVVNYMEDKEKKSKILGLGSTYPCGSPVLFRLALNNQSEKILHFDFNYNREFFFRVVVDTKKGKRALYYTPTNTKPNYSISNAYGFVLGSNTKDGHWHSLKRDLNLDLKSKESDNEVLSVEALYVSPFGKLDDIYLTLNAKDIAKTFVKAYLADNSMVEQITSKRMIEKLRDIDDDVKEYFRAITSYHEMMYFHDLKAMVIAISKGEEIKFYFSWNGRRWILEEVL